MGLLYPDHPNDPRRGLFEDNERPAARRTPRSSERRPTKRRDERLARDFADEPLTPSTTSSELKSLNDLMVRPPAKRRDSDRPAKESDEFREARRQERRERRERRERATRERTPSPEPAKDSRRDRETGPEPPPSRQRGATRSPSPIKRAEEAEQISPKVRGPRKAERPRYERTSTYESDRRRESSSPRKRRPSYANSRRNSSYDNRRSSKVELDPARRRDSRSRYHSRAENELVDAVPPPPAFTRTSTADTLSDSEVDGPRMLQEKPRTGPSNGESRLQWKAPLETILSESHPQSQPEPQPATSPRPSPARYNKASQDSKPALEREESLVSSYLEGSNLESGMTPPPRAHRPVASVSEGSYSEYFSRRPSRRPRDSVWDEVEYYKYGQAPEDAPPPRRRCCMCCDGWSRRRKLFVIGGTVGGIILLIILIAVGASVANSKYDYHPSDAKVNNTAAFTLGGATHADPNNVQDSTAKPVDAYTFYRGPASNFPDPSKWISFQEMWNGNVNTLQNSCAWLDQGENNSPAMIQDIFDAVQSRAAASLVDHRLIFAMILQESNGCPRVGSTTSSGGVRNPGLMQSHNGHVYNSKHSRLSILQMVQDGVQGTEHGDGVVQALNLVGSPYKAARYYNSGYVPEDGDLSTKSGATRCYVSDVANRLTGWVRAETGCHEEG